MKDYKLDYKPVLITWTDAASVDEWCAPEDLDVDTLPLIRSVGFLIAQDLDRVTLALNHNTDSGDLSCTMFIPLGMIKELIPLS